MLQHPLYDDDALVGELTRRHVEAGRTIFQLWLTAATELEHSRRMLDLVAPPHRARVLSLGCGVGGMERYWQRLRPDLRFMLQNLSRAQLDQCMCQGDKLHGDAKDIDADTSGTYDVTVLAYMLGHVQDQRSLLLQAMALTWGPMLVLDVPDAGEAFTRALHYRPPSSGMLRSLGFVEEPHSDWHLVDMPDDESTVEQRTAVARSRPGIWIRRG